MKQHFTTREVAKILSLPEWRIRSCVRAGFLAQERGPGERNVFSFQDLLLLRTTKGLLNARVPLQRIRRILQSLKKQLPEDKNLWNVSVYADGRSERGRLVRFRDRDREQRAERGDARLRAGAGFRPGPRRSARQSRAPVS